MSSGDGIYRADAYTPAYLTFMINIVRVGMPLLVYDVSRLDPKAIQITLEKNLPHISKDIIYAVPEALEVIGDFVDPPAALGDRFRVEVKVVTWGNPNVLKIPASALFRHGDGWSVFLEILEGLKEADDGDPPSHRSDRRGGAGQGAVAHARRPLTHQLLLI